MLKLPGKIKTVERIRPGVKALIVHQGKILVIQEQLSPKYSEEKRITHDFPGGGIDLGESLITGLKREVKEEIGLEIEVGQVVGAWDFVVENTDDPTKGVQIVCIGYECQVKGNDIEFDFDHNPAQEDIFAAKWLTPEEILASKPPLLESPGMIEAVKTVQSRLRVEN